MIEFIKFLFSPKGEPLSRRQYWGAIFLLLSLEYYTFLSNLIQYFGRLLASKFEHRPSVSDYHFNLFNPIKNYLWTNENKFWEDGVGGPSAFLILVGTFLLVSRMMESKGIKSVMLKLLAGISVFCFIYIPSLYMYRSKLFWSENMDDALKMIFAITHIIFGCLILIGLVLMVKFGTTASQTPALKMNVIDTKKSSDQLDRIDYLLASFKIYLVTLIPIFFLCIMLTIVDIKVRDFSSNSVIIIVVTFEIAIFAMLLIPGINIKKKRVRNMGKSHSKVLRSANLYAFIILGVCVIFEVSHINFLIALGLEIASGLLLCCYLFFLYLALCPEKSIS